VPLLISSWAGCPFSPAGPTKITFYAYQNKKKTPSGTVSLLLRESVALVGKKYELIFGTSKNSVHRTFLPFAPRIHVRTELKE
jgi:hypothetical protein